MRPVLVTTLLLLVAQGASPADFAAPPPRPILGFERFEMLEGEIVSPKLRAGYRFYVDPARGALFSVMRYRVRGGGSAASRPTEKFVWKERPGQRQPLRCFEWVEETGEGVWRELDPGGAAYESEMRTLLLVLSEQNRAYRRQVEPEVGQQ